MLLSVTLRFYKLTESLVALSAQQQHVTYLVCWNNPEVVCDEMRLPTQRKVLELKFKLSPNRIFPKQAAFASHNKYPDFVRRVVLNKICFSMC